MIRFIASACMGLLLAGDVLGQEATLRIDRTEHRYLFPMNYYQGDRLLGRVGRGEVRELKYVPDPSGRVIITQRSVTFGIESNSPLNLDNYLPGSVLEAKYGAKGDITWTNTKVGVDVTNLQVDLEPQVLEREIASEIVETPAGAKRTVRRSRTIERSVSITDTSSVEAEKQAHFAVLSIAIRGRLEASRNLAYKHSETVEQSAEIDGSTLPRVRVVWVEKTLVGKASVSIENVASELPFTFRENIELRLIPLK